MMDRERRLREPLRWTPAGRLAVALLAAIALLAALGVGIYAAVGGTENASRAGCIEVSFASTTGSATLHACDGRARQICAAPHSFGDIASSSLVSACRRAGDPVG